MNISKASVLPRRRPVSLAQEVMSDLMDRIRSGQYKPGEKMPTEPEVMAEQGVSRTVVREAISRLQAAGLVETRQGVGTFVKSSVKHLVYPLDLSTLVTIRDVLDMLELRVSLEAEAAGLASTRRTDEQLRHMREALLAFEEDANHGGLSVEADYQFHLQIALATHNKYFEDFYRYLGTSIIPRTRLDTSQFSAEPGQSYLFSTNREHESILDAIIRQDAPSASAAMRRHLSNSRERLKRASEANARE
ncbi:MAG: FadR family transcriptional regulator [Candidatus Accumulibacter sp.]|jgi:GntR family transcriptional repressor for pyruvate dehydrogenase complex|nr:FadR family transcriptional regulator [Accumulibacter sp.]